MLALRSFKMHRIFFIHFTGDHVVPGKYEYSDDLQSDHINAKAGKEHDEMKKKKKTFKFGAIHDPIHISERRDSPIQ